MTFKEFVYSALGQPSMQTLYTRLIGYLLRLKGYNNYPSNGGDLGIGGEDWLTRRLLTDDIEVCLDIGAHKGMYAQAILQHSSAHVYALEPNPAMASASRQATKLFDGRCTVIERAISNQAGRSRLRFRDSQTETASLSEAVSEQAYSHDIEVEVDVTTIDALVAEFAIGRIDLIKLDVEGLELACLVGAAATIATMRPRYIQVEMHWHHLFTGTTLLSMSRLLPGYHVYRLLPRGLCPVDPRATLDNLFAYSNYLFSLLPLSTTTAKPLIS